MKPILITGAAGLLGANLQRDYRELGLPVSGIDRGVCDLTDAAVTARVVREIEPGWIIHTAALTRVDWCESHPEETWRTNVEASRTLAQVARQIGARMIYISTDSVFDGMRGYYSETDEPRPLNIYARSKLAGERAVLAELPYALVVRTVIYGWNLGPKQSLAEWILSRLESGLEVPGFEDAVFSPILVNDLGDLLLRLLERRSSGVFHVAGSEACTKFEFANAVAETFGFAPALVRRTSLRSAVMVARRPLNTHSTPHSLHAFLESIYLACGQGLPGSGRLKGRKNMPAFEIGLGAGAHSVGGDAPTYFIADISANHDGSLERARELIRLAAECGASAAKFQNFRAPKIVSDHGFSALRQQVSHQAGWKKSVVEVYQDASLPWEWTESLKAECASARIDYFSTPYDLDAVDMLDEHVELFKIGSGDITWRDMVQKVAAKNKPVLLATGASDICDVRRAVEWISEINPHYCVMQCNTNYTGSIENFRHIHLNVLRTYRALFPDAVLGLSCHTPGHTTVLGAVALGARVVEKHFTDDTHRDGPDHAFSMTPSTWREMVDRTRELEVALGSNEKNVCPNERETVVVQRRCLRAARELPAGTVITSDDVEVLRPAMPGCILPYQIDRVIGSVVCDTISAGDGLQWSKLSHLEAIAV